MRGMAADDLVLGITGASGVPYAIRLLEVLVRSDRNVHVSMSPAAFQVFHAELGLTIDSLNPQLSDLLPPELEHQARKLLRYYHIQDFSAGIASGSFLTAGMVVCPCSMGTVSAIAHGTSSNLIHRAADVHLKEKRKLILVPRETPLGLVQLRNMTLCAEAGAVVLPAMPAYYTKPQTVQDMVDFVVGRIADQLDVEHDLLKRWGTEPGDD